MPIPASLVARRDEREISNQDLGLALDLSILFRCILRERFFYASFARQLRGS